MKGKKLSAIMAASLLFPSLECRVLANNAVQEEESLEQFVLKANQLYSKGEYAEAAPLYQKILKALPDNKSFVYRLGVGLIILEDYGEAEGRFSILVKDKPREAIYLLALAYIKEKQSKKHKELEASAKLAEEAKSFYEKAFEYSKGEPVKAEYFSPQAKIIPGNKPLKSEKPLLCFKPGKFSQLFKQKHEVLRILEEDGSIDARLVSRLSERNLGWTGFFAEGFAVFYLKDCAITQPEPGIMLPLNPSTVEKLQEHGGSLYLPE